MSGQTWTPAPKKGAIPLHPMTFGTILGRAFAGLRHNPKVLFGFAVVVQFIVGVITAGVMVLVIGLIAMRVASVPPSSPDYGAIVAGSVALGVVAGIVMALATVALSTVIQGLVAADVSYAALSRKATLGTLWRRVKPAFWRLVAWSMLQSLAALIWVAVVVGAVFGILSAGGFDEAGSIVAAVGVGLVLVLGSIPLYVWLTTKLLVVPSVLVLENASLRDAMVRSWRLIRGRFWPALGVVFLIGLIMNLAMQVIAFPATILSSVLTGILVPTGEDGPSAFIGILIANVLPQILLLAVQAIAIVVLGTGATLIYLDSRMRYEALDQTLIRHVDLSSQGVPDEDLGDPYAVDPARAVSKTPPAPTPSYPYAGQGYPAQPGYPPQPGYPVQTAYPAPGAYPTQPGYPPVASPQPGYGPPQPGYPAVPPVAPGQSNQPAPPTPQPPAGAAPVPPAAPWTAPGADA